MLQGGGAEAARGGGTARDGDADEDCQPGRTDAPARGAEAEARSGRGEEDEGGRGKINSALLIL